MPSSLKSLTETDFGRSPVAKLAGPENPPWPLATETETESLNSFTKTRSREPSALTSAVVTDSGPLPVAMSGAGKSAAHCSAASGSPKDMAAPQAAITQAALKDPGSICAPWFPAAIVARLWLRQNQEHSPLDRRARLDPRCP